MDELFNMANCFTLLIAAKRFAFGRGEGTFVVTSKRGGEGHDDRVVMPHFVLVTVSVLALVWSALGLGFGVTEDVVGAGVAAFWTVYNLALMAIVIGFALRPLQKRHAVRFRTAVPVELVDEHSKTLAGVTLDVSEGGCTLLWPEAMAVGSRVGLRLNFGPKVVTCQGEVRSVKQGPSWVGHGIEFVHSGHVTADQLADAIYNTTVPEMFTRLSQRSWVVRQWTYLTAWISRSTGVRQARREAALPVRVSDAAGSFLATTRDLSANGLGIISPTALEVGAEVRVELVAATGDWRRTATVTRVVPVASVRPEYATWHVGLRLHPSDAGALDSLLLEEAA
jgi:hypothetical protein